MGDSRLGPYLTLTLFFFKDRKISSAVAIEKKNKQKKTNRIFLIIFDFI
jgi:hypothetical protein